MGANSTEALEQFLSQYLMRCKVVGDHIVTPDRYDITAGGNKILPAAPCSLCGKAEGHGAEPCPELNRTGCPDFKRGQ